MISIKKALESVSPDVRRAFELADEALTKAGVTHVLIGGLAVNAHGHHYSTKDVDFLVIEDEAFDGDLIKSHRAGVPFAVGDVKVDLLTISKDYPVVVRDAMVDVLDDAAGTDKILVVSGGLLVWMKLNAGRTKDLAAVEGLLKGGYLDTEEVEEFLSEVGDERVLKLYKRCADAADKENAGG